MGETVDALVVGAYAHFLQFKQLVTKKVLSSC